MQLAHTLSTEKLIKLANHEAPACLTVAMPCHKEGGLKGRYANKRRFKCLLQEARKKLRQSGHERPQRETLLKPLKELAGRKKFWETQNKGLFICVSSEMFFFYYLPFHVGPEVTLDRNFSVQAVLPYIRKGAREQILKAG